MRYNVRVGDDGRRLFESDDLHAAEVFAREYSNSSALRQAYVREHIKNIRLYRLGQLVWYRD